MQDPLFFHKLQKGRQPRGVVARVVRKWTLYDTTSSKRPLHVGMVLADAKGDAMYAQISADLIEEKEYLFEVGTIYMIKKFVVEDSRRTYKAVDKRLMIEITGYTTVEKVRNPPTTVPEIVYKITPFSSVQLTKIVYNYTDVIGYLVKYEPLHTFVPKRTEQAKMLREIYLKDLRENVMKITLWGDLAVNFNVDQLYDENLGNLIVCLVVGCTPREDFKNNDKVALSGSPACQYYFNPQIPEAAPFHSRFRNTPVYIDRPVEPEDTTPPHEKNICLPIKTVAELHGIDPFDEEEIGPFKCTVTVTTISNATSWWYMSCKPCKKKADQQPDRSYKCPKCLGSNTIPRYTITFTGTDGTGDALFFAFDDEAQKLIQKDCESVLLFIGATPSIPPAIRAIVDKTFTLSVDLTNDSCKKMKKRQYQVKVVLERPLRSNSIQTGSASQLCAFSDAARSQSHDEETRMETIIDTPERRPDILQIESACVNTPNPTVEIHDNTSKDKSVGHNTRSKGRQSKAQRNLEADFIAMEEGHENDESNAESSAASESAAKRLKTTGPQPS